jgi:hypothetical protein
MRSRGIDATRRDQESTERCPKLREQRGINASGWSRKTRSIPHSVSTAELHAGRKGLTEDRLKMEVHNEMGQ